MASLLARVAAVVAPPFCWSCGADAGRTEPLCGRCRAGLRWLGHEEVALEGVAVWSAVSYEGPARALVRALKYRGAPGLADPLAATLAAGAPLGPGDVLVPVPMPALRRRRRGYNQAELIAEAVSRRCGRPVHDGLVVEGAARQVGRGRDARLHDTRSIRWASGPVPARVVLVDDVATTGATVGACARALRRAGAADVAAITYARTPGR